MSKGDFKPGNPHRFRPGQSGNPGGSTRGVERMFREEMCKLVGASPNDKLAGVRALVKRAWGIAHDPDASDKDALAAIKFLTERAAGLPRQHVEISDGPPPEREIDWSQVPIERRRELLAAIAEVEALTMPHDGTEH